MSSHYFLSLAPRPLYYQNVPLCKNNYSQFFEVLLSFTYFKGVLGIAT